MTTPGVPPTDGTTPQPPAPGAPGGSAPAPAASPDVRFVEELVAELPGFADAYEAHVFNENGVLPHVFFMDVVEETVQAFLGEESDVPDWRRTLDFLEERTGSDTPEVQAVIVTSFLNDLPYPGQPGHDIVRHLPPRMAATFARIRPKG
ncbi:hypothetical protein ACH44C_30510 [Streptomyces purpureus]|uniref:DUF7674 family protein n=1 Tax=Streptomyces purpureus TaxID=1951 RepID=UPI0037987E1A